MALHSARVRADIVEASEFPEMVARYAVRGVPKTIINEHLAIEGAVPEADLRAAVERAARETVQGAG
jgi:predicted DsbA family dithiol-disulfide isomerase